MKLQTRLFMASGLLILVLGIAWFMFSSRNQIHAQVFPAIVNRDCAPWDGAAFSMSVSYDLETVIYISIWRSPDIKFPSTFVLPNDEEQVGNVYILPELGPYILLSGEVSFQRVEEGVPIEGRFDFLTEAGQRFTGRFKAEWGDQVVYCG